MSRDLRFWLVLVGCIVVVALLIGGGGSEGPPLSPRSVSPQGAKGVVDSLERLGANVDIDSSVPDQSATTALLLQDRLTQEDTDRLIAWVERGGVLVVADRNSRHIESFSSSSPGPLLQGTCDVPALQDAQLIALGGWRFRTSGAPSCFGDGIEAFIVTRPVGSGTIVSVGNAQIFMNENLDDEDAAVVVFSLLAPQRGTEVSFIGPSVVDFGEGGAGIPTRVINAILQLLAAFLIYALFRSRRLGGVVAEPVPVRIEGSELVLKAGLLSERAKDPASAAEVLRGYVRTRASKLLASPPGESDEALVARIADRINMAEHDVAQALTGPVQTDEALGQVSGLLTQIDERLHQPAAVSTNSNSLKEGPSL